VDAVGPINATAGERQDDSNRDATRDIEPEDRAPVGHREHGRAEQRTENTAELLHGPHHTQRRSATIRRPQVGHERQCRRHQPTSADPLQHLPPTSTGSSTETAVMAEPTTKTDRQKSRILWRATRSESRPISGRTAMYPSRKPEMIGVALCSSSIPRPTPAIMFGKATTTT